MECSRITNMLSNVKGLIEPFHYRQETYIIQRIHIDKHCASLSRNDTEKKNRGIQSELKEPPKTLPSLFPNFV
ncbi:hypothetical protein TRIATDRAFT_298998 [Trichoderma atroviride IMI 206040]|uniref:Uncharacterized protein n=1 Tax=Hypocrea atroviridis (strain ATCC 20476 / IMI 206040) TaxID=452589 RepID=G9NS76_HYPAI|nr:uncharacterized protein TRIATDRAFT_298998 [Trichoderma atroviride IMI 206040]EHK46278.1 hypothetical protein TRIATDRAFT_298998 [Trichoderma atroviride IMI 206040]